MCIAATVVLSSRECADVTFAPGYIAKKDARKRAGKPIHTAYNTRSRFFAAVLVAILFRRGITNPWSFEDFPKNLSS